MQYGWLIPVAVAFVTIWLARVRHFSTRAARIQQLAEQYQSLGDSVNEDDFGRRRSALMQRTVEVHRLWRGAMVKDSTFTESQVVQPAPWMSPILGTQEYSARDNWLTVNEDVISYVHQSFQHALGYYRDRAKEAKNPLDALLGIAQAPQSLVRWLGLGTGEGSLPKLLSVVWSVALLVGLLMQLLGVSLQDFGINPFHVRAR